MSHVFISYSHLDKEYAHQLANALEREGFPVWIDNRIDYGMQWPNVIQESLDNCRAFIVIMTPRSMKSQWVQNELSRAMRKKKPLFPLLLEGDVWLSVEAVLYVDVRGSQLPPSRFWERLATIVPRGASSGNQWDTRVAETLRQVVETGSRYELGDYQGVSIDVKYINDVFFKHGILATGYLVDTPTPEQVGFLRNNGWLASHMPPEFEDEVEDFDDTGVFEKVWPAQSGQGYLLRIAREIVRAYQNVSLDHTLSQFVISKKWVG